MKIKNNFLRVTFLLYLIFTSQVQSKALSMGEPSAKVTVKVFSSLTCPHCANFHTAIFNNLKMEYIEKGLVRFEHHAFPLDLAETEMDACMNNSKAQDEILNERIEAQKKYKIDSTPTVIVNGKKYSGKVDYKKFKKIIEKNL